MRYGSLCKVTAQFGGLGPDRRDILSCILSLAPCHALDATYDLS